jgi:WD40 repeat protein
VRGHDGAVGAVVVTPAGQLVVSGGWDGKLMAWDGRSGERRLDVAAHEDVVAGIALDKNAAAVATAADDRAARVWSLQDGRLMAERRDFRAGVKLVRFTDDHRNEVLCGSWDGTFRKLKY